MRRVEGWKRLPWLGFTVSWLAVGLVLLVPRFQDGYLYNAAPILLAYVVLPFEPSRVADFLPWLGLHVALALALTAIGWGLRLRCGPARFGQAAAIVGGLFVGFLGWSVHRFWPDGIFFDAHTIYYDVSEFVEAAPGKPPSFGTPHDLAMRVFKGSGQRSEHYLPHYIGNPQGTNQLIVWGTWPEHHRFRTELKALLVE